MAESHMTLVQKNELVYFDQWERPVFLIWAAMCNECKKVKTEGQQFEPWWIWHDESCSHHRGVEDNG